MPLAAGRVMIRVLRFFVFHNSVRSGSEDIENFIFALETEDIKNKPIEEIMLCMSQTFQSESLREKMFDDEVINFFITAIVESANEVIKKQRNYDEFYNATILFIDSTKDVLKKIQATLGCSDIRYQQVADKVAETILLFSVRYF